jgi:uncharacterized membrane protein YgcG
MTYGFIPDFFQIRDALMYSMVDDCNFESPNNTTMNFNNPTKNLYVITILLMLVTFTTIPQLAKAQGFSRYGFGFGAPVRRANKMNIGLEVSMGTRSFHLKSDITTIDKMKVPMEGGNFGAVIGNRFFRVKIKQGYFNSASAVSQKFKMAETKGLLTLYLLQALKKKPKYFEPYFLSSVDYGALKFYGSYVKTTPGKTGSGGSGSSNASGGNSAAGGDHPIECGGPQGDPDDVGTDSDDTDTDQTDATNTDPDPATTSTKNFLGKISTMYANAGLGLECHIPVKKHFVNLFAEMQYGVPFSTTSKSATFNKTKASGLLTVNFGLSFGISR